VLLAGSAGTVETRLQVPGRIVWRDMSEGVYLVALYRWSRGGVMSEHQLSTSKQVTRLLTLLIITVVELRE
jgi:hypothetical protein